MSNGGGVREHAVVLGELQEARGNVESLRRRVKKWSAKLAECRRRGDMTGGGGARGREDSRGEPAGKGGAEGGGGA